MGFDTIEINLVRAYFWNLSKFDQKIFQIFSKIFETFLKSLADGSKRLMKSFFTFFLGF